MSSVYINRYGMISPAGVGREDHLRALSGQESFLRVHDLGEWAGRLSPEIDGLLSDFAKEHRLRNLDRTNVMAGLVAKQVCDKLTASERTELGVVMGSSRGATLIWEREHEKLMHGQRVHAAASPMTTLGTLSSVVASSVGAQGMSFSMSSACSTSLQAIGVGASLIKAGTASRIVAGGSEASLSLFTFSILKQAGIYATEVFNSAMPYRPFSENTSGIVIGEGAGLVLLESEIRPESTIAEVLGFGASIESAGLTGISSDAFALQVACRKALAQAKLEKEDIDLLITHGGGTLKGDQSELVAYQNVFGSTLPRLGNYKWCCGHLLGSAGIFSVVAALLQMEENQCFNIPFASRLDDLTTYEKNSVHTVMVCGLGFGGTAASLILRVI